MRTRLLLSVVSLLVLSTNAASQHENSSPTISSGPPSPSCSASNMPNNIVPNGDFECGLLDWTLQVPDSSARTSISVESHTWSYAFEVDLLQPAKTTELGVSARIISKPVPVEDGTGYELRFWTYFDGPDNGFIGVTINGGFGYAVDARDKGWGAWHENIVNYKADSSTAIIKFEFLFGMAVKGIDRLDTITLVKSS